MGNPDLNREKMAMVIRWIMMVAIISGLFFYADKNTLKQQANLVRLMLAAIAGIVCLQVFISKIPPNDFHILGFIYDVTLASFLVKLTGGAFANQGQGIQSANFFIFLYPLLVLNGSIGLRWYWGVGGATVANIALAYIILQTKTGQATWPMFLMIVLTNYALASTGFFLPSRKTSQKPDKEQKKEKPAEKASTPEKEKKKEQEQEKHEKSAKEPKAEEPSEKPPKEQIEIVPPRMDSMKPKLKTPPKPIPLEEEPVEAAPHLAVLMQKQDEQDQVVLTDIDEYMQEKKVLETSISELQKQKEEIESQLEEASKNQDVSSWRVQELLEKVNYFSSLIEFSSKLGSTYDIQDLLSTIASSVRMQLNSDISFIMLENAGTLEVAESVGLSEISKNEFRTRVAPDRPGLMKVMLKQEPLRIVRSDSPDFQVFKKATEKIEAVLVVPLKSLRERQPKGLLGVAKVQNKDPYSHEQEEFLRLFATQAATHIHQYKLMFDLEYTNSELLTALAQAIESRDPFTRGHVRRVAELSVKLARAMKMPDDEIKRVQQAAILHDIGKIAVKRELLTKPTELSYEEYSMVKRHSLEGYKLLSRPELNIHERIKKYVLYHHESWDGQGYPNGLKGDQIPNGAQIIAVTNAFDAMISDRPYRKGIPKEEALKKMSTEAGSKYNPKVLHTFFEMMDFDKNTGKFRPPMSESIEIESKLLAKSLKRSGSRRKSIGRKNLPL